jgi:hypothetical protein
MEDHEITALTHFLELWVAGLRVRHRAKIRPEPAIPAVFVNSFY